ncbi:MAG: flagellar basal body L-ring protein FlgH [Phycisphaerae bacterium]|nr:flagellar basal body L-ring protein FlgH [Phycisphaerae bacterium]
MNHRRPARIPYAALTLVLTASGAVAQTSSIGVRDRQAKAQEPPPVTPREAQAVARNPVYDKYSWTTSPVKPPKTYRPGDLLTIIVRQQRSFEAESDLKTDKKWDVRSELEMFPQLIGGQVGAAVFDRGKPNVDYQFKNKLDSKGDTKREDTFTTRLTAKILDIKPNGTLVLEGRARVQHDEEISEITIVGTCRKDDVTADNTVLSTQIADLQIVVQNEGALRSASQRGWIPKLIDLLRPI